MDIFFSISLLSVIACGCDKHLYRPNFQKCSQIVCVCVRAHVGGWEGKLCCVFRKGYGALFIIWQEFICCLSLFSETDHRLRGPLLLLCCFSSSVPKYTQVEEHLFGSRDAQYVCPVGTLKLMRMLLWTPGLEHSQENGTESSSSAHFNRLWSFVLWCQLSQTNIDKYKIALRL